MKTEWAPILNNVNKVIDTLELNCDRKQTNQNVPFGNFSFLILYDAFLENSTLSFELIYCSDVNINQFQENKKKFQVGVADLPTTLVAVAVAQTLVFWVGKICYVIHPEF